MAIILFRAVLVLLMLAACTPTAPKDPAHLTLGLGLEPPNLDPTQGAAAATDEVVYANVFEGLTRIGADGRVRPALAQRWTVSADGLRYVFHLRRGVRFHDGAPFDAADVLFSLNRARAPDSLNAQRELFAAIRTVTALAPDRVEIRLTHRVADLPYNLAWGDAVMVDPASAATNAAHPVGTGPFRFQHWTRGAAIELKRNPDYWGPPPALSGVTFLMVGDASAAFAALMAGEVDGYPDFPAPELLDRLRADGRFRVVAGTSEGETILALNHARAPLNQLLVRRALGHAIDRSALIAGALSGYGTPIGSHFPPHDPDALDLTGLSAYNPPLARRLLAQAGVAPGLVLRLALPPTTYARRCGEIIAMQLAAVGVTVRIEPLEWAQWLDRVFARRDYDMTLIAHTEPRDLNIYARPDYYFNYDSPLFRQRMTQIEQTADPVQRRLLLQAAQRQLAHEAVNVYLFQFPKLGVWNADVRGVWRDAPMQANDVTAAFWHRDTP